MEFSTLIYEDNCDGGAFPTPLHGMASVNFAMYAYLNSRGQQPIIFDLSPFILSRAWYVKMARLLLVFRRFCPFLFLITTNSRISIYISASAGKGQLYEMVFIFFSRILRHKIFIHHHSFVYLDSDRVPAVSRLFFRVIGTSPIHIVLCEEMANRIRRIYPQAKNILVVSNSALISLGKTERDFKATKVLRLGFLGNIEFDKGIEEFLSVLGFLDRQGVLYEAVIAGPFFSEEVKSFVIEEISRLSNVSYIGPVYGVEKHAFWNAIDVLLFPTRNDAEPLTVIEALSFGIPVLTRNRGCLMGMVDDSCGAVFVEDDDYVRNAVIKISLWNRDSSAYREASCGAKLKYLKIRSQSQPSLEKLYLELIA